MRYNHVSLHLDHNIFIFYIFSLIIAILYIIEVAVNTKVFFVKSYVINKPNFLDLHDFNYVLDQGIQWAYQFNDIHIDGENLNIKRDASPVSRRCSTICRHNPSHTNSPPRPSLSYWSSMLLSAVGETLKQ